MFASLTPHTLSLVLIVSATIAGSIGWWLSRKFPDSPPVCEWGKEYTGESLYWHSECGEDFSFNEGAGPVSNGFTVCPFCARNLKEKR